MSSARILHRRQVRKSGLQKTKTANGGLIRLLRSRYDMKLRAVKFTTSADGDIGDSSLMPEFARGCSKAKRMLYSKDLAVWYRPFLPPSYKSAPQLITYADAGYSTLSGAASIGPFTIYYFIPLESGGIIIKLQSRPIEWQSRKMKRVARSSHAAEAVALSPAIDFTYWMRDVYLEILILCLDYASFNEIRPIPLVIPFDYSCD